MRQIDLIKPGVNPARLDAELRARLGKLCHGLSVRESRVRVFLDNAAEGHHIAEAELIVQAHDPGVLTPVQEQAAARRALPFFTLEPDALLALVDAMDSATFRREMARAFIHLRDLLGG